MITFFLVWLGYQMGALCKFMTIIPAHVRKTSPNGLLHLISLSGEIRTSLKVHGVEHGQLGVASSDIVRDVAIVEPETGKWEVVSVGYDRIIRISTVVSK